MKMFRFHQQGRKSVCLFLLFCLIVSNIGEVEALSEPTSLLRSKRLIDRSLNSQPLGNPFLEELAKDTWAYLKSDWATDHHLPWSWRSKSDEENGSYANVTEIGFYALSWLAAYDLHRSWSPNWTTTEAEVTAILNQLRAWQTGSQPEQPHGENAYHKVFYQWYWVNNPNTPPVVGAYPDDHVVPSMDNAWLAASLITIREYAEANNRPALMQKADAILSDMDFRLWYDYGTHRFYWGDRENPAGPPVDAEHPQANYFSNENRMINFVARALGQLSAAEFQLSLNALYKPSGSYNGIHIERMAWDGSYFTYAGPALFIREMDTPYGLNTILPATQAQIQYAKDQNYAAWGLSAAYGLGLEDYVYQQGAPPIPGYPQRPTERKPGLVAPHASALALITALESQAKSNLQQMYATFNCDDPSNGFYDSIMTKTGADYGKCSSRFSALAQEWIFLSIAAYENGFIWKYFYRDSGVVNTHAEMYIRMIAGNAGAAGTTLSYIDGTSRTVTSQASGNYSLKVLPQWSGTVTPSHACFTFNPISRQYSNIVSNQTGQNYTATLKAASGCADITVSVGGANQGRLGILPHSSARVSFSGLSSGPIKIASSNTMPIMGAERVIYKVNGVNTSFTEMMGLPQSQLDTTYWLPWYNNVGLDTQLRIANVSNSQATITVTIGGVSKPSFNLAAGASTRVSYAGVDSGPVKIVSTQNIVAAERVIYKVNKVQTSFSEMMALPQKQLNTVYYLPWYDSVNLDTQLRIANVTNQPATVTVTIGGQTMPSFNLAAGASTRVSYAGKNNGPVKIVSNQTIAAAERVIYKFNGIPTSFTEMMALPNSQLQTTYWLPWYNNVGLNTQLRISNVSNATATVRVYIAGQEMTGSPFNLPAGTGVSKSYAGIDKGPVKIVGTQNIVVSEPLIYKVNGTNVSFSEMMGLPNTLLDTTYWLPWYNNVDLDTQLRFGVP